MSVFVSEAAYPFAAMHVYEGNLGESLTHPYVGAPRGKHVRPRRTEISTQFYRSIEQSSCTSAWHWPSSCDRRWSAEIGHTPVALIHSLGFEQG
jgi:hypothetical protein